jgi:hypothetical protein
LLAVAPLILPRSRRYTAPEAGPSSSIITQWFQKAIVPWLLAQLEAVQRGMPYGDHAIDLRDIADGLGTGDDAAVVMRALRALPENTPIINPGLDLSLRQTLAIANRGALRLITGRESRPIGGGNSPVMRWAGEEGGRMLFLDRSIFCEIAGYTFELDSFNPGAGSTAYVAIDIDGEGGTPTPGQVFYGFGSQCSVSRVNFRAHRQNPNYEMLRIAETATDNQEYHDIDRCWFEGGLPAAGAMTVGTGLKVGRSPNAKAIRANGCNFNNLGVGIRLLGGSAHLGNREVNSFANNGVDVLREFASEPSFCLANSEHSRQHLVDKMGYGFTIKAGTRLDPSQTLPGTAYIVAGQELSIEGIIQFDARPPKGATLFDLSTCRRFISTGINFAPGTTYEETGFGTAPTDFDCLFYSIGHSPLFVSDTDHTFALPPAFMRVGKTVIGPSAVSP